MVQRGEAVHRVAAGQVGRRGGSERRQRPPVVRDLARDELTADRAERDEGEVPRQPRVGPVPAGQLDDVGIDLLHVHDLGDAVEVVEVQIPGLATAEHQDARFQFPGRGQIAGIGDDLGHPTQACRRREVGIRRHQHRDSAQPRQRGDGDQRAGPGFHQHADARTLTHSHLDEAAHHVVDATVHRLVGVHPSVEEQRLTLRGLVRLLTHDAPQRNPGVVVDLSQAGQPRQRAGGLHRERARGLVRRDERVGRRPGQAERHLGGRGPAVGQAGRQRHPALAGFGCLQGHRADTLGHRAALVEPAHPGSHRRPRLRGRLRPHNEPEMTGADEKFVHIGVGGGTFDAAYRGRLTDVVDLSDDGQHRTADVGQRHQIPVDRETAGHHPVVGDELFQQLGDRRPRPCDPPLGGQEPALLFAGQQRLAVVELTQEIQPRLCGLDRVEHLEPGPGQPAGDVDAAEHVIGHEVRGRRRQARRQVHRHRGQRVHRRSEADDAGQVLGAAVGRRLVGEHPALRVAGEVHIATGHRLDRVDRLAEGHHVIGEVALHPALDLVR